MKSLLGTYAVGVTEPPNSTLPTHCGFLLLSPHRSKPSLIILPWKQPILVESSDRSAWESIGIDTIPGIHIIIQVRIWEI